MSYRSHCDGFRRRGGKKPEHMRRRIVRHLERIHAATYQHVGLGTYRVKFVRGYVRRQKIAPAAWEAEA